MSAIPIVGGANDLTCVFDCRYLQFVKALQEASRDNLEFVKQKAIKAIFELLRAKPEQEALLLAALVDKLGDPSRRLASNVSRQ